ncbi:HpcH/HpaI aldolase/citrate lyase family protein [Sulfurimonas diazotrophicus]|uniref:Aldolase/citrate lyase family protein n=1 Tax=Sulfurimonas diazotrophicus TaxID=3131939 RepID=A0ABZ3HD41_9BACT
MFQTDLPELERAAETLDTGALDALLSPRRRTLNGSAAFHAPLMLSAHRVKHLSKIPRLSADAVMFNLEDGVSAEQKPVALRLCALALSRLPQSSKKLIVRVNPLDEGGVEEIAFLAPYMPDAIRVPKVRTAEEVERIISLVPAPIEVHLSIETKEAWLALASLRTDSRVCTFYLGILDLFADLGLDQALIAPENPTLRYLLSHFFVTCRALGVKPVSFVYQDYRNVAGFAAWLALESEMGFDAKGCIAPKQAEQVMAAFGRDEAALSRAREIVALFEAERAKGVTGFTHEVYGFVDEPIYKGALALLKGTE